MNEPNFSTDGKRTRVPVVVPSTVCARASKYQTDPTNNNYILDTNVSDLGWELYCHKYKKAKNESLLITARPW